MRASVVLPTPGGPQNIMLGTLSESMSWRKIFPSPKSFSCPKNSSSVRGRMRLASGRATSPPKSVCCSICVPLFCPGAPAGGGPFCV